MIEVDVSIGGERVCRILDRVFAGRPMPEVLMLDNGPEFAGNALDAWADQHRVTLHFIQPGKPVQNAFIESFNGNFRDECLNEHGFLTLQEAQVVIEAWRREYNEERTHSTIGDVTPMEFIHHHQNRTQAAQEFTSLALVYRTGEGQPVYFSGELTFETWIFQVFEATSLANLPGRFSRHLAPLGFPPS